MNISSGSKCVLPVAAVCDRRSPLSHRTFGAHRAPLQDRFVKHLLLIALLSFTAALSGLAQKPSPWEKSVVRIEVARKSYDYYQPWNRRNDMTAKTGLVVGKDQILTTAQDLSDATLVRMQSGGRGAWAIGSVVWVDYYANLAVLTTRDTNFWTNLKPAKLQDKPNVTKTPLQILRWREGKLETRQAEFTQFAVRRSLLSDINQVCLEVSSEMQDVGYGEPLVADSQVAGLVAVQYGRTCRVIPASFLRMILDARRTKPERSLGYFHFYWQPAENPSTLANFKLPGKPRGVLVINVPARLDGSAAVLQPHDIILQIDGFNIDIQGDYTDPDYGPLMLENLATRGKWAGDDVKMKIWRDGREQTVSYRLPKYDFANSLVPAGVYDQPPDYLIVGGLVFQPLTTPYLQRWGKDWQRNAPFRFNYYRDDEATKAQPSLVILSQVLPDKFNIGYQEYRGYVVEKVNDQPVTNLAELQAALQKPKGEFHVIDFVPNETLQRIVIAAGDAERAANRRILERFGISAAVQITPKNAAAN